MRLAFLPYHQHLRVLHDKHRVHALVVDSTVVVVNITQHALESVPAAKIAAHPECPDSILKHADHVGSTRSILNYVTEFDAEEFIVATEQQIIHQMIKSAPEKTFIAAPGADGTCDCANCPFMALNSLEKLYLAMANEAPRIEMPDDLREKALAPLQKMLDLSPAPAPEKRNAA